MNKLLLCLLVCAHTTFAQTTSISSADSAKLKHYLKMADRQRLGSTKRQLYLDSALMIQPTNAYFWQQKSMPLVKAFKCELALPFLDSAVKYNPKRYLDYRAFNKCIFCRTYKDALKDFHAATALNGNSVVMDHSYDFYKGICHLQLNNYDSARYLFQKCIDDRTERFGKDWVHYLHPFYLGVAYYELYEYGKALASFNHSIKLNPTMPDAHLYKAYCISRKGDKEKALEILYHVDSLVKKGYDMNEDNTRHILYPYQLKPYYLQRAIQGLEQVVKDR